MSSTYVLEVLQSEPPWLAPYLEAIFLALDTSHKHPHHDGAVCLSSSIVSMDEHTPCPRSLFGRGWLRPPLNGVVSPYRPESFDGIVKNKFPGMLFFFLDPSEVPL